MSPRAVVFGGTGMLGRAVVSEGRRRGAPVLGLSREQADVTDRERLRFWVESFRPALIVNCAAFTRVDDCQTERERAFAVNGEAVANVVAVAEEAGADLIHVSTDYVFDGEATEPYREDAATAPRSVYGASKLAGEERALAYGRALVVRASWLFGPGGPNFVRTIAGLIAEGQRPLRVVDDQTGCPTYTPFLARALWRLVPRLAAGEISGVLHYRNHGPVTWYGFAVEIARLIDRAAEVVPVTTEEFPRPAPRPRYSVLDVRRFEELTGRRVAPWGWGLGEYLEQLSPLPSRRQG